VELLASEKDHTSLKTAFCETMSAEVAMAGVLLSVYGDVMAGLHEVHVAGVCHRDVHSGNVVSYLPPTSFRETSFSATHGPLLTPSAPQTPSASLPQLSAPPHHPDKRFGGSALMANPTVGRWRHSSRCMQLFPPRAPNSQNNNH